jgi:MoxR-like ATPase
MDPTTSDPREVPRVVASVLLAVQPVPPALVERANQGLARLRLGTLSPHDAVVSTPEELAPVVPLHVRDAIADLLVELAEGEPLRQRVALAYVALWGPHGSVGRGQPGLTSRTPDPPRRGSVAEHALRAVVGPLPAHQRVNSLGEEQKMQTMYRSHEEPAPRAAPVVDPLRARVHRVCEEMTKVIAAVERVVIGKRDAVIRTVVAMTARGHVLLVDTPGVGKTLLCKTIAGAIGGRFGRVQLTPDLMPMDVTGATTYDARAGTFVFRPGPVFTNILLADEINRATPKTQSALLEVMEERTVTVDGTTHPMADTFQVLATMNPLDHEGTFPLPAAQIDRFMVLLELGLPSVEDEVRVLDTHLAGDRSTATPVVSIDAFLEWQKTVPMIHVTPEMKWAVVRYVDGLRKSVPNGHALSPRATIAWMRAAQARAMLAGREFVTLDDVHDVSGDVLRHRLWISPPEIHDRLQGLARGHVAARMA